MEFEIVGEVGGGGNSTSDLQRTDKWFEDRKGKFTGSVVKNLMGTTKATSKMGWLDINKVFDFNDTALKHIYKVGMERHTRISEMNASSAAMRFGTENEAEVHREMIKQGFVEDIKECEFIDYPGENLYLGASPDGRCLFKGETMNLENKSAVSWNGVYERIEEPFDEKHKDFWQIQLEMMVQGLDKTMFVVSYPMQSELFDHKLLTLSEIHAKAMIRRVRIANSAIDLFKDNDLRGIRECLEIAVAKYKEEW